MRPLRSHQERAISLLRSSILAGHRRPMVQAPCGFGKTLTAAHMIAGALRKGNRVCFVVPAISLIDQTVTEFMKEGIRDIGVIQADHPMTDYAKPVQVASVQTLSRRTFPSTDFIIVDEAHVAYRSVFKWMAARPDAIFTGLSATPWTRGLGKHYDDLIIAATTQELIDGGYLVPFQAFGPDSPDLDKVRTIAGDYHEGDLSKVMQRPTLIANVVENWLKHGDNRPTFCFCVDRAHAGAQRREFERAGVPTAYVDAYTPRDERAKIERDFHDGSIKVIVNIGVLTTGIDWDVRCLILARPTKSEILLTQIIGRALRTAPDKELALIFDHTDTTERLGYVTAIHHTRLDMGRMAKQQRQVREKPAPKPKKCPACNFMKPPRVHKCPYCGFAPEKQPDIAVVEGELVALDARGKKKRNQEASWAEKIEFVRGLRHVAHQRGRSEGWVAHTYKDRFGVWPNDPRVKYAGPSPQVSQAVLNWVKHKDIRYAKSRSRADA